MSGYFLPGPFILNFLDGLAFLFGVLYIVAALGFGRRPWSYRLGLLLPVFALVVVTVLYACLWLEVGFDPVDLLSSVVGVAWVVVAWSYLRRSHVKAFLLGI